MQKENFIQKSTMQKFSSGFTWNLIGSISFETSHIFHNTLLLFFLGSKFYGLIGSLFSIVYLIITVVDLGFESSIAPFLKIVTQNKSTCKKILAPYLLIQLLFLTIGSSIFFIFYRSLLNHEDQTLPFLFFFILILSEGIRIFLRRFLHNLFINKTTVLVDQIFAFLYYATVWGVFLCKNPISLRLIFIPYLFNSLFVTSIFGYLLFSVYKKLPENNLSPPKNFLRRIIKTRYFNALINIENFIISGNFIVPFFAITFGLRQAGLFKLASTIANSIKAVVKSVVHFSGSALFVSLKSKSDKIKKKAFYTIAGKLNQIIIFTILFLSINFRAFTRLYPTSPEFQSAWTYAFIFIGITLLHQFFVVYEQFYIVEELANKLFIIKSVEFLLFYALVIANKHITPLTTLINTGLILFLSLSILAIHAYARWGIKPYLKVKLSFLIFSASFSSGIFLLLTSLTKYLSK